MNFLDLCKETSKLSGIQSTILSVTDSSPGTQHDLVIKAVKNSWKSIQNFRSDFHFKRDVVSITVSSGVTEYTINDIFDNRETFGSWIIQRFLVDYKPLSFVPYNAWVLQEPKATDKLITFSIKPQDSTVMIHPVNNVQVIEAHYHRGIQALEGNADVPYLPPQFHMLIVYGAVMDISVSMGDMMVFNDKARLYEQMMGQLMRSQVPARSVQRRPFV